MVVERNADLDSGSGKQVPHGLSPALWLFSVGVCACVCMCIHAVPCAWRSEINVRWLLSHSSHKFLRQGFSLSLLMTNLDRLAGQQATWSLLFLLLQHWNYWHSLPHLMFLCGCWDLNSGSHACATSTFTSWATSPALLVVLVGVTCFSWWKAGEGQTLLTRHWVFVCFAINRLLGLPIII